jgi:hypothetical protein
MPNRTLSKNVYLDNIRSVLSLSIKTNETHDWFTRLIYKIDLQDWFTRFIYKIDLQDWFKDWFTRLIYKICLQDWFTKIRSVVQ